MSANWNHSTGDGCGLTAAELFNVILVYEDQASALRGLELYHRLVIELGGDSDFNLNVRKFAVLGVGRLAEVTAAQAAEADLIIVCTRAGSEPSEQVRAWFQHWADMRGRNDCDFVVLGGTGHDWPGPDRPGGFFHNLSRRGGVTVFSPATVPEDATARVDRCRWFPCQLPVSGVDGGIQDQRPILSPFLNQPFLRNS